MFTGIIEEVGTVCRVTSRGASKILEIETGLELAKGDSLAVNGVCLTVVEIDKDRVAAEATAETVKRTTLKELHSGSKVNLEPSLTLQKALGGHLVQGHVDEVGKIQGVKRSQDAWQMEVEFSPKFSDLVVDQGSVTLDGVSLTVLEKSSAEKLTVNLIPETLRRTTLKERRVGDKVNLEFDVIAKYVREQTRLA
ncbi:riboflavin synthase [candidate division WOR-3 bacterium]|nr:riboflavin synthase [candidate division WOR-3 bacterium]